MNPQREKMDGGVSWYSCGKCGAMWERREDAKECCQIHKGEKMITAEYDNVEEATKIAQYMVEWQKDGLNFVVRPSKEFYTSTKEAKK